MGGAPDEDLRAMGLDNGQILKLRQEYNKSQGTWGDPQIVLDENGIPVYKQFKTDNTGKITDSRVVDGAFPRCKTAGIIVRGRGMVWMCML